jgi:hypothetical protein
MKQAGTLLLIIFISLQVFSQDSASSSTIRYQYRMSEYFLKNRHLIRHLDTIVPVLFTELATARTCDESCKTDYILELRIHAARIISRDFSPALNTSEGKEYYNHTTGYSFHAYLLLRNNKGRIIKYLDMIDSGSKFEYKTKHILNVPGALLKPYFAEVVDPQTQITSREVRYYENRDAGSGLGQQPLEYFNNHRLTDPQEKDLERLVEMELFSLHIIRLHPKT